MTKRQNTQKGFTLVELAIVLVIVGLLIAGILKGQELITNAQVTSTIQQMEAISGAINTFKQNYGSYPGDMANAVNRLSNCAAPCADGNGDSDIELAVGAAGALGDEANNVFLHMSAADLITNMDGTNVYAFGQALPLAAIGGGYKMGQVGGAGIGNPVGFTAADFRSGKYLLVVAAPNVAANAAGAGVLTPTQGGRIDRTLDDGTPNSGSVIASTNCQAAATGGGTGQEYDQNAANNVECVVAFRMPN